MKRVLVRRIRRARPRAAAAGGAPVAALKMMDNEALRRFNPALLGLGDLKEPSQEREAVAAIFDLTGFTSFCNQVDAYLAIPQFLSRFLDWFFAGIGSRVTERPGDERSVLWVDLPMKVKFMGDGLLILWNARSMNEQQVCRLVTTLYDMCRAYRTEFYPRMAGTVNKPPAVLRCGVARGKVFTVGNGNDFVGHCINNASRLSHLNSLSFCFPHRGFPVREHLAPEYRPLFVPKYVSVRGVGENEQVWVVKKEFEALPDHERAKFRDVVPVGNMAAKGVTGHGS